MSEQRVDLPFSAEYAKSNRASCKACSNSIEKDTLRLAIMVQCHKFDGKVPNWFHEKCFWKRAKVATEEDFHGYNNLRWEDQQLIKDKILGGGIKASTSGNTITSDINLKDFNMEYAKSNRSVCRGCDNKIEKDLVRISKKNYETERAKMYGPQDYWYHVDCFLKNRLELEFLTSMDITKVVGYKNLKETDRLDLITKFGKVDKQKRKAEAIIENIVAKKTKVDDKDNLKLKAQSDLLWKLRDNLNNEVSNEALKMLLEYNNQYKPIGISKLLDAVSDAMLFGALDSCPECKAQLTFSGSSNGYHCTGNITEWTKCQYSTKSPSRIAFKIPEEYHDVPFLEKYKYVKRNRLFSSDTLAEKKQQILKKMPLLNISLEVRGKLEVKKPDLVKRIEQLGGSVVAKKGAFCISNEESLKLDQKYFNNLKSLKTAVVSVSILDELDIADCKLHELITKYTISDWPTDVAEKIVFTSTTKALSIKEEKQFISNMPNTMKVSVKGGAAVDPESGLDGKGHILQGKGKDELYTAVLGMVDITRGTNSFYKLQLIEADNNKNFWVYRAWGRVGTTIGGNKSENFKIKEHAIEHFTDLYLEKTGNKWNDRNNFNKVPNKFFPLDIDYGGDDEESMKLITKNSMNYDSKLHPSIQEIIKLIFDIEQMKTAMLEFEIDLKKMPLGKLSKKQIENAYKILSEIQTMIDNKTDTPTKILDASNRFYTLIPHDFGLKKPIILNSLELVQSKADMVNNLLDIEIAYNLLKGDKESAASQKSPLDIHFEKLNIKMNVIDKKSDIFENICQFVKNTHAQTHNNFKLEVEEVFEIERHGEKKIFRPFKELNNRMLLWHGSRLTNFAGILSQGLRIAPPEAPVTGYMFGKGVYFADMVSKSANYCFTSRQNPLGLMLLSEVALGNMYELTHSEYVKKLPNGKHSTKGCGQTMPDPSGFHVTSDGLTIPMGKGIPSNIKNSSLLYNEYIVYDVAQINMKYLIKMKFIFN